MSKEPHEPNVQPTATTSPGGDRLLLALLILAAVYLGCSASLPPDVFWGSDEGGKYLQTVGWSFGDAASYSIPYGGQVRDPDFHFYRHVPAFPRPGSDGAVSFGWQPWFSFLSMGPYHLFGMRGLYLIPLLCGLAAAWLAGVISSRVQRGTGVLAMLMTGLASPVLFYSLRFWGHIVAVCMGVLALWLVLVVMRSEDPSRRRAAVALPLVLAAGLAMRHEFAVYIGALVLVLVARSVATRQRATAFRPARGDVWALGPLCAVGLIAALGWAVAVTAEVKLPGHLWFLEKALTEVVDVTTWTGLPGDLHLLLFATDAPVPPRWSDLLPRLGAAGLLLTLLSTWPRVPARLLVWAGGAVLVGAACLGFLLSLRWHVSIHGLVTPAAWVVVALLPAGTGGGAAAERRLVGALTATYLGAHMLVAVLVDRADGGLEWGPRFLLLAYPLVSIVAADKLVTFLRSGTARLQKACVLSIAGGLILLGASVSARGMALLHMRQTAAAEQRDWLAAQDSPVVTDMPFVTDLLTPLVARNEIYLLDEAHDLTLWRASVGKDVARFVLLAAAPLGEDSPLLQEFDLTDARSEVRLGIGLHKYHFERRPSAGSTPSDDADRGRLDLSHPRGRDTRALPKGPPR